MIGRKRDLIKCSTYFLLEALFTCCGCGRFGEGKRRFGLIGGFRGWGMGKYYNCDGGDSSLFCVT